MNINRHDHVVLCDVDDTLINWQPIEGVEPLIIENFGFNETLYPIKENIEDLKSLKFRGFYIRVHSQSGWEWAEKVVKSLGLEDYVDSIETKPQVYIDDLDANAWMTRFYKRRKV